MYWKLLTQIFQSLTTCGLVGAGGGGVVQRTSKMGPQYLKIVEMNKLLRIIHYVFSAIFDEIINVLPGVLFWNSLCPP